ncbi:MAG: DUF1080 domain-containing protein [Planctomycetes bacterium]|nr:DUF1080 domain-containing protein [Planctomycetota bacterium]
MLRLLAFVLLSFLVACSEEQRSAEPEVLYDGKSFAGWNMSGGERSFMIEGEGVFACGDEPGVLVTRERYADFVFQCQVRSDAMSSAAIALRCGADPRSGVKGVEVVIADMGAPMAGKDACGSLRGVTPARSACMQPTGTWNPMKITLRGNSIEVSVNGVITASTSMQLPADGHIAIIGEGEFFWLRELSVTRL